jgi:hypothetical protein
MNARSPRESDWNLLRGAVYVRAKFQLGYWSVLIENVHLQAQTVARLHQARLWRMRVIYRMIYIVIHYDNYLRSIEMSPSLIVLFLRVRNTSASHRSNIAYRVRVYGMLQ